MARAFTPMQARRKTSLEPLLNPIIKNNRYKGRMALNIKSENVEVIIDNKVYLGKIDFELLDFIGVFFHIYIFVERFSYAKEHNNKLVKIKFEQGELVGQIMGGGNHGVNSRLNLISQQYIGHIKGNNRTKIKRAVFHLFNFYTYLPEFRFFLLGSEKWMIELRSYNKEILKTHRYNLSYFGEIRKKNGSFFYGKDLKKIEKILDIIFSFVQGNRCPPICVVGYDENDQIVWLSGFEIPHAIHTRKTSFENNGKKELKLFFKNAVNKLEKREEWRSALEEAINWYLSILKQGKIEGSQITLAQIAFERLSYELSVRDKKLLSHKGFDDLKAADNLRMLFRLLDIPYDYLDTLISKFSTIAKRGGDKKWDLPRLLTEVRNSYMHPKLDQRKEFSKISSVVAGFGIMYLELSILALCEYNGKYWSRLMKSSEPVPWSEEGKKLAEQRLKANSSASKKTAAKKAGSKKAAAKKAATKKAGPKKASAKKIK